ncbi:tetratricopeptide repeat protein [Acrocarpospora sp. B8E8]|uniref:tetratricopeptide repeat protein n=1 Tax=Acrocarpospora sp. B8E8 TaxID=3153572 RepID=UPI00325D4691
MSEQSTEDGGVPSPFEQASDLHRRGRPDEALVVLEGVLRGSPDDIAARYAMGICLTDLGRAAEAQPQFRRVLDAEPRHYEAAYRLGRLLQADADYEGAATAYRQVLAVTDFRDAQQRLRACETELGGTQRPGEVSPLTGSAFTPGPPPLRTWVEGMRVAERGKIIRRVRFQARHMLSQIVKRLFLGAVLAVAVTFVMKTRMFTVLALIPVVTLPFEALIRSATNGTDFYEYGMEVRSGLVRRQVQFIWYYQIAESPTYLRTLGSYLTHTASLGVRYNEAGASSAEYIELSGIGTPEQVKEISRYLESRVPPERMPIRGPWT